MGPCQPADDTVASDDTVLAGWTEVSPAFLEGHRTPLAKDALRLFYDGQAPGWRHALAPDAQVPRRSVVAGALARLQAPPGQSMVLLVAAGGEGKSTALRQIAVDLVGHGHRVLYRQRGTPLDVDGVLGLPPGATWTLVSDDADEIAKDLERAIKAVEAAGRRDVHWLLAARYEDWRGRFQEGPRSVEPEWASMVERWPEAGASPRMLALTTDDAARVVGAWEASDCLGALAELPPDARAQALVEARQGPHGWSAATFLDAILGTRYTDEALRHHVGGRLAQLGDHERSPDITKGFLYLAAADVAGVDGVDLRVLADLLGVDRVDGGQILDRLGQEGLGSGSGGVARARHPRLAQAGVVAAAGASSGIDLEQVFANLVRGTGQTGRDLGGLAGGGAIMNCGPTLAAKLQELGLAPERSSQIARSAADQAADVLGDLVMFTISRARTYRETGQGDQAVAILRAALAEVTQRADWGAVGRQYLYDSSTSECDAGHLMEAIMLAGLSIADLDRLGPVSLTEAKLGLDGLGAACSRLSPGDMGPTTKDAPFQHLIGACAYLGPKVTPKWDEPRRLRFHQLAVRADELGVNHSSSEQAVTSLSDALEAARHQVHDLELTALWGRLLADPDLPPFASLTKRLAFGLR